MGVKMPTRLFPQQLLSVHKLAQHERERLESLIGFIHPH